VVERFQSVAPGARDFTQKLADALSFNEADLRSNRCRQMSRKQLQRLILKAFDPIGRAMLGVVLVVVLYAALGDRIGSGWIVKLIFGAAGVALVTGLAKSIGQSFRVASDLFHGQVESDTGRLYPSWQEAGMSAVNDDASGSRVVKVFHFRLGGQDFPVPERAYHDLADAFENGLPTARIYYTPSSRRILSIEVLAFEPIALKESKPKPLSIWK
jgi:hypothetical protein